MAWANFGQYSLDGSDIIVSKNQKGFQITVFVASVAIGRKSKRDSIRTPENTLNIMVSSLFIRYQKPATNSPTIIKIPAYTFIWINTPNIKVTSVKYFLFFSSSPLINKVKPKNIKRIDRAKGGLIKVD